MKFVYLSIFVAMQVVTQLFFKWGSIKPEWKLPGFILGNVIGMLSTLILISLYKVFNANVLFSLGLGFSFIFAQLGLSLIFHSQLTVGQWLGVTLISIGIFCVGMFGQLK